MLCSKRKRKAIVVGVVGHGAFSKSYPVRRGIREEAAGAALDGWEFQHRMTMEARPVAMQTACCLHAAVVVLCFCAFPCFALLFGDHFLILVKSSVVAA
jgi:hypothetical protein